MDLSARLHCDLRARCWFGEVASQGDILDRKLRPLGPPVAASRRTYLTAVVILSFPSPPSRLARPGGVQGTMHRPRVLASATGPVYPCVRLFAICARLTS